MTRFGFIGILAVVWGLQLSVLGCSNDKKSEAKPEALAQTEAKMTNKPQGDAARRLLFEKRCNEGHFGLCGELGIMWEHGYGGNKDKAKADEYYKKACNHAVPKACETLGKELKPEDQGKIYEKDCAQGLGFACNNLGHMLLGDMGIPKDEAKARELLDKGCEAGYAAGCLTLSKLLEAGIGGPEDKERAEQLLNKAKAEIQAEEAQRAKYLGTPTRDKAKVVKPTDEQLDRLFGKAPVEKDNHSHNH